LELEFFLKVEALEFEDLFLTQEFFFNFLKLFSLQA